MRTEILRSKQVTEIIGIHPTYFRCWLASAKGERFRRVVKEREPNYWSRREVQRWLDGAEY